jgi:hypothetical protein
MTELDDDSKGVALDTRFFSINRRRSTVFTADDVLKQVEKFSAKFSITGGSSKETSTGRRQSEQPSNRGSFLQVEKSAQQPSGSFTRDISHIAFVQSGGYDIEAPEEPPFTLPDVVSSNARTSLHISPSTMYDDDSAEETELSPDELPKLRRSNSVVTECDHLLTQIEAGRLERRSTIRRSTALLDHAPPIVDVPREVAAVERVIFAPMDDDTFEDWLNLGDVRKVGDDIAARTFRSPAQQDLLPRSKDSFVTRFVVGGGFGDRVVESLARGEFAPNLIFDDLDMSDPATAAGVADTIKLARKSRGLDDEDSDEDAFQSAHPSQRPSVSDIGVQREFSDQLSIFLHTNTMFDSSFLPDDRTPIVQHLTEVVTFLQEKQAAAEAPGAPWTLKEILELTETVNACLEEGDDAVHFLEADGTAVSPQYRKKQNTIFASRDVTPSATPTSSGAALLPPASPQVSKLATPKSATLVTPLAAPPTKDSLTALEFTKQRLLPALAEMGQHLYRLEWGARYVIAFLDSLFAMNEHDAWIRDAVAGRCVTLGYQAQAIQRAALLLQDNVARHEDFANIRTSSEACAENLLAPTESMLKSILTTCPFRDQRTLLKQCQPTITAAVNKATLFFQEFDSTWVSFITFHEEWKISFLDSGFCRLQGIAHSWLTASLGFVDPVLNRQVLDQNTRDVASYKRKISMAEVVRRLVVNSGADFSSVSVEVKGVSSRIVGLQLCMGARYLCEQTSEKFDNIWGFSMSYCSGFDDKEGRPDFLPPTADIEPPPITVPSPNPIRSVTSTSLSPRGDSSPRVLPNFEVQEFSV